MSEEFFSQPDISELISFPQVIIHRFQNIESFQASVEHLLILPQAKIDFRGIRSGG